MVGNSGCIQTMVTQWASFSASALPVPCACLLHPACISFRGSSLFSSVRYLSLPQCPSVLRSPCQSPSVVLVRFSPHQSPLVPTGPRAGSPRSASSTLNPLSLFGPPRPNRSVSVTSNPFRPLSRQRIESSPVWPNHARPLDLRVLSHFALRPSGLLSPLQSPLTSRRSWSIPLNSFYFPECPSVHYGAPLVSVSCLRFTWVSLRPHSAPQ